MRGLIRFGLLALVPVVALGVVIAQELSADIQQRYLQSARTSATLIAQAGVQPLLSEPSMTSGLTPTQIAQIDLRLQGAALSDEVRRLKVWNRAGMVVYSDNPALIGRTFAIDDDLKDALNGTASASVTDGHDEENSGDNLPGPLVQVYVPLVFKGDLNPSGAFELYLPYAPVQAAIDSESHQLYALLAIGLALFYASMFPIVALADRWRRRAEATAIANVATQERLNRLKSQFLIRISHQFRTALVGIEGFSEVIRDSEQLDLAEVKAFASDIHSDAERLDQAFARMLALDDMEAGRVTLDRTKVDVNQVVAEVVERAHKQSPAAVITVTPDPSSPLVDCDHSRVQQLLSILIDNAIRYSHAAGQVDISVVKRADEVEVVVTDHGPGMPADDSGAAAGNGARGTGLGLPIARQIVRLHGGRIWFNSKSGQGTQVHFTLPVAAREESEMKAATPA
ncbi:MAG TPA: HAMP domain-containing sensor histidine kinase [Candidatus Dormibacteraeota bacterium]|nr:HAMP domain-containing sensor histidine kinase [Candidatus Dormibacteraeota bacterium]